MAEAQPPQHQFDGQQQGSAAAQAPPAAGEAPSDVFTNVQVTPMPTSNLTLPPSVNVC